jgi:hypothetical protein
MAKNEAKNLYLQIKNKDRPIYKEEVHCPMIIEVMDNEGTMTAFCKKAGISDGLFYKWCGKYPIFNECYQIARMRSKYNWEKEGEDGQHDENFNFEYWRIKGACRYGVGKSNRVRMAVNPESNPYEQYQQLISQANGEEFTASEIKQLMEAINVGRSAFEAFKLQEDVNKMREDILRMKSANANDSGSIASTTKTD